MIGKAIKSIRESKKLTLRDLAKKANLNFSYICLLENGQRNNPSYKTLSKIADALGVGIDELIAYNGKEKVEHSKRDVEG